jgi:hypothetical protein
VQRLLANSRPDVRLQRPPPHGLLGRARAAVFDVVASQRFDTCMYAVIIANIALMAAAHADMDGGWTDSQSYGNLAFTAIFTFEMIAKIFACGVALYANSRWNSFDALVVLVSWVGVAIDFSGTQALAFLPLIRTLRVVRIVKLIPRARGLKALLLTLYYSLPALLNVAATILLFFYVWAVIGVNLFGRVKPQEDGITERRNFSGFGNAMLTLFCMMTGAWVPTYPHRARARAHLTASTRSPRISRPPSTPQTQTSAAQATHGTTR